jgi:hypothetical protein
MSLTNLQKIRYELADTDVSFPMLTDTEYEYFLEKNYNSVPKAAMDAAKTILLKMSMRSDQSVDIFSIRGTAAAKQYMQALQMYIKNPDLNAMFNTVQGYVSGVSKEDMLQNDATDDNNYIINPTKDLFLSGQSSPTYCQ